MAITIDSLKNRTEAWLCSLFAIQSRIHKLYYNTYYFPCSYTQNTFQICKQSNIKLWIVFCVVLPVIDRAQWSNGLKPLTMQVFSVCGRKERTGAYSDHERCRLQPPVVPVFYVLHPAQTWGSSVLGSSSRDGTIGGWIIFLLFVCLGICDYLWFHVSCVF